MTGPETSLHTAIKDFYTGEGDRQEVLVDGYLVDVVSGDLLIEVQTRNFTALKSKLTTLLDTHPVRLVHPIALEKWIVRMPGEGNEAIDRRKSPRRGRLEDLFYEMVRIPHLVMNPNFSLEVLLIREEEVRRNDGQGSWRRKGWSITDRRLLEVIDCVHLDDADQFGQRFLPTALPQPFTNRDFARQAGIPPRLAAKMTYSLKAMNVIEVVGYKNRSQLFRSL